eukprot:8507480-Pyramimonas_sp.AAC.1
MTGLHGWGGPWESLDDKYPRLISEARWTRVRDGVRSPSRPSIALCRPGAGKLLKSGWCAPFGI